MQNGRNPMTSHHFRLLFSLNLIFIIIASLVPSSMPSVWHLDKVGHFAAYGSLFALALFAFQATKTRISIFFLAVGLGIMLEWLQSFVPGRDMSILDAITNTVGLIFGLIFYLLLNKNVRSV